jgi:hypothetical protein
VNLKDRFIEWLLSRFDKALDALTCGRWSKSQGEQRIPVTFQELPALSLAERICLRIAEISIVIASASFIGLMLAKGM